MRAKGELLLVPCSYPNPWTYNGKYFESDDIGDELTVLSTGLRISGMENNTSEGSTSGSIESTEVNLGELKVRAIGKNTTEGF